MFAGRLAGGDGLPEVAAAARRALPPSHRSAPARHAARWPGRALHRRATRPRLRVCRRALQAFCRRTSPSRTSCAGCWLASITAADLWDDESVVRPLHAPCGDRPRRRRAQRASARAHLTHLGVHLFAGELRGGRVVRRGGESVKEATGSNLAPYGALEARRRAGQRTARPGEPIEASVRRASWPAVKVSAADGRAVGDRVALQRPRRAIHEALVAAQQAGKYPHEPAVANWGADRADRGGRTKRQDRARSRCARPALEDDERQRHRLGARRRGPLARAAERGGRRRASLSRGDRAAQPHQAASGARTRTPALRRVAAPRRPPRRRARAPAHRP